jgi:DNA-binding transcriptional MerR regulator
MGVTRKTLLVFENMGLLTHAFKDEESGYRYYSADNMTQIR